VTFDMRAFSATLNGSYDASYTFALEFSEGGPGPNPIPLPPAAWAALATVAGFGGAGALRRLRVPA
jgi:hypothetical protein